MLVTRAALVNHPFWLWIYQKDILSRETRMLADDATQGYAMEKQWNLYDESAL
ncbi:MAG: hypothetical protein K2Y13_04040 [Burkholderiaceae bacterium]|nr:hypothetical protein [Burkholderiaceae bacterium]